LKCAAVLGTEESNAVKVQCGVTLWPVKKSQKLPEGKGISMSFKVNVRAIDHLS